MRYAKYIFILSILIGLLGPMVRISALETTLGPCIVTNSSRVVTFQGQTTEEECRAKRIQGVNTTLWQSTSASTYQLLTPIPCKNGDAGCVLDDKGNWVIKTFNPGQPNGLGVYLNLMIKIVIGLAAVLSVVMIVVGGLEYMTSELISSKEAGKERIRNALLGLIIALGAYALLFTINPDLLNTDFNAPTATVQVTLKALGTCIVKEGGQETTYLNISNDDCIALFNVGIVTKVSWTPNSTAANLGTCIVQENGDDVTYTNFSDTNCNSHVAEQPTLRRKISWTPNSSSAANLGTCIVKEHGDQITYTNLSDAGCNALVIVPTINWTQNP